MMALRSVKLATLAAALVAAASAYGQRVSLAERVSRLETQVTAQNNAQANIETLNRIHALQQEVTLLRGLVEQLQNQNAELQRMGREQYIDLDSRLSRIEGASIPAVGPTVAADPAAAAPQGVVASVAASAVTPPAEPLGERPMYDAAFQALRDGDYAEASRRFQAYLEAFPTGALAPNAWYWLGESYYVTQNYDVALTAFQSLLQSFPDSGKAPDALLKLGYSQFELGQTQQGEATLRAVIARFPGSDAARLAQSRLRSLALDAG